MSSRRGPQADGAATTVNTVSLMAEGLRNLTTKANAPAKKELRSGLMIPIQSQGGEELEFYLVPRWQRA